MHFETCFNIINLCIFGKLLKNCIWKRSRILLPIFRRATGATGVKGPEMTPKMELSLLKSDFHHMLGLKTIDKEG